MNQDRRQQKLHTTFMALHVVFVLVVFIESIATVRSALGASPNLLLAVFAGVEAVATLLFLIPATLRFAGFLLVPIFLIAFTIHVIHGEWHLPLLIYTVITLFVMAHGPVKTKSARGMQEAT